MSASESKVLAK